MNCFHEILFIFNIAIIVCCFASQDGQTCHRRERFVPHIRSLWKEGYPIATGSDVAMCEGTITLAENGEICIDGRVSYLQLANFVQESSEFTESQSIFAPAAKTISINGHLTTGTGNIINGDKATLLYNYVTSYIVDDTKYTSNSTMTDMLLAASRGTIDGVCLDPDFVQEETFYEITHSSWAPDSVDIDDFSTGNLFFGSRTRVIAEYHTRLNKEPSFLWRRISMARMILFNLVAEFPTPQFVYDLFPVFQLTGILRANIVGTGQFSTSTVPQPLLSPLGVNVENIEMETDWSTFLLLVDNGIFSEFPRKAGSLAKKIVPIGTNACWTEPIAAIDFQIPLGFATELDDFVENVFYPKLLELNSSAKVTLHFGKRVPPNSNVLQAALNNYESCGVTLNPIVETCYHPLCARTVTPSTFEYPSKYYD